MHNFIHTRPARLSNLSSINHFEMEARVGIEPTNTAFAEPCLTTWRPRLPSKSYIPFLSTQVPFFHRSYVSSCSSS
jgi:hypothetical protein